MTPASGLLHGALRLVRNLLLDLRFGAFLGGSIKTSHATLGAYDVSNSDYRALSYLFADRVLPGDELVDLGCGKGRVLNWWLSRGWRNRMVGIELDQRVAERARDRLRRYPNVRIIAGDAVEHVPSDGTVFYMFNPFDVRVMTRLRDKLERMEPPDRRLTIIYYNCAHVDVFERSPRWLVERLVLPDQRLHPAAIMTRVPPAPGNPELRS
jgi:SAM-dependent methyltransferase